jgi:addiction module HigA family antidote
MKKVEPMSKPKAVTTKDLRAEYRREELGPLTRGKYAFKSGLRAIHPGEFLREILEERGLSQAQFARAIGVSAMRVSCVVKGVRPVSAELALLFGKALGQSAQYWLHLQAAHDLKQAERVMAKRLKAVTAL